jgi:uncharacterized lipoprotein YddW (UPF0748 family)
VMLHSVSDQTLARSLPVTPFRTESVSALTAQGANVIAKFDTGEAAVVLNPHGKGRVVTFGFHLMRSTSPVVAAIAKETVSWFRTEAGASTDDPLAVTRAEWVAWRGDRVTQLVRELSTAAKVKNPTLVISSSGGPSPFEFYACYRDARRWLAEGINDEVFPMDYTTDPNVLSEMLELQAASAPRGTFNRIFPGLQIYATRTVDGAKRVEPQNADIVKQELRIVQQQGYQGFCLFAYNYLSDEIIQVVHAFGGSQR